MDRATIETYEAGAGHYATSRGLDGPDRARNFAEAVGPAALRLDLGCGPGHHLGALGGPTVGLDAAHAMVREARQRSGETRLVQGDLARLPFRAGSLGGAWANKTLQHLPATSLPLALADLHRAVTVGGRVEAHLFRGEGTWVSDEDNDLPGRFFQWWTREGLADVVVGAGFAVEALRAEADPRGGRLFLTATRQRTLADTVGPTMRMLVCGLNPSLYAADAGVGYARPGNRFWPALRAAGLTTIDRDAARLLVESGIGMTDLVKRASVGADELTAEEYRIGLERVERLCAWLRPGALCLVGLSGWRAAADRRAAAGWQPAPLGGTPVYVMPSTSGRNARTSLADLADHLRTAAQPRLWRQ